MKKTKLKKKLINRFNRGAILAESFVAISIILIMTGAFVTLSMFVNNSYNNSQNILQMSTHIRNIQIIFTETEFTLNNQFTFSQFANTLNYTYGEFQQTENNQSVHYKIYFNEDFQVRAKGKFSLNIQLTYQGQNVSINLSAEKDNKVLIENTTLNKVVVL